jgi:peptidoglycan/LPS O-acetylase OafA/YrhL
VICKFYGHKLGNLRDILQFQLLRFGRLYPVHLVVLVVYFGMEVAKYIAATKFNLHSPNTRPFVENSPGEFLSSLLLLQAMGRAEPGLVNGPSWSISVEFYTYLLFALLVYFSCRMKTFLTISALAITVLVLNPAELAWSKLILRCLGGFFLGCGVFALTRFLENRRIQLPSFVATLALLLTILFLCYKPGTPEPGLGGPNYDPAIYFLSGLLILGVINGQQGMVRRWLSSRALVFLGTISYSLYMTHFTILWAANQAVRVGLKPPELLVGGKSHPQLPLWQAVLGYGLCVALVVGLSYLMYLFVEKNYRDKSRKLIFARLPRQS